MLRTIVIKVKKAFAISNIPCLWSGGARNASRQYEKLSCGVLVKCKSTNSGPKIEGKIKSADKIKDTKKEIEITETDKKDFQSTIKGIQQETLAQTVSPDIPCKECRRILNEIFGSDDTTQTTQILTATTIKDTEEKLAQKLEIVDETPLVEAPKSKVEGFNTKPKILGEQETFMYKKTNVDGKYRLIENVDILDEIAKRCLDSPTNKIDDDLLKEMERLSKFPDHCKDGEICHSDVMKKPQRCTKQNEVKLGTCLIENNEVNLNQDGKFSLRYLASGLGNVSDSSNPGHTDLNKSVAKPHSIENQIKTTSNHFSSTRSTIINNFTRKKYFKWKYQTLNKQKTKNNVHNRTKCHENDRSFLESRAANTEYVDYKSENIMKAYQEKAIPFHLRSDLTPFSRIVYSESDNHSTISSPTHSLLRSEWIQTIHDEDHEEVLQVFHSPYVPSDLIRDYMTCDYKEEHNSEKFYDRSKLDAYNECLESDPAVVLEDSSWHKEYTTTTNKNIQSECIKENEELGIDKPLFSNIQTNKGQTADSDHTTPEKLISSGIDIKEATASSTAVTFDPNKVLIDPYDKRTLAYEKDDYDEVVNFTHREAISIDKHIYPNSDIPLLTANKSFEPVSSEEMSRFENIEVNQTMEEAKPKESRAEPNSAERTVHGDKTQLKQQYYNIIQPEAVVNPLLDKGTIATYSKVDVLDQEDNLKLNIDTQVLNPNQSKLNHETEQVSLSELLKKIRKRNSLENCREYIDGTKLSLADPIVGSCGKKNPPCPPPAPTCPPSPCPKSKPPCPKPCPPKPPDPCAKPKCPPPPKKNPCDPCKKYSSIEDTLGLLLSLGLRWISFGYCN